MKRDGVERSAEVWLDREQLEWIRDLATELSERPETATELGIGLASRGHKVRVSSVVSAAVEDYKAKIQRLKVFRGQPKK